MCPFLRVLIFRCKDYTGNRILTQVFFQLFQGIIFPDSAKKLTRKETFRVHLGCQPGRLQKHTAPHSVTIPSFR